MFMVKFSPTALDFGYDFVLLVRKYSQDDFWSLLLNTCLKQPLGTSPERFDVLVYSCGFDDPDLKMSITSQLVHLVSNSNLDKGKHFKSLERPVRKFVKRSLDLLETGVHEAKLRVLLQFIADTQVEARSINIHR